MELVECLAQRALVVVVDERQRRLVGAAELPPRRRGPLGLSRKERA
jgi:hypothetical protein